VVQEVWQDFGTYAGQQIRLYEAVEYIELEYTIGPLPQRSVATCSRISFTIMYTVTIKVKKLSAVMIQI